NICEPRTDRKLSRCSTSSHRYEVAGPDGLAGLPAAPVSSWPRLNGRKYVFSPASFVVRCTWSSSTAKDRKSTRLNSSHVSISYAVFCLKKKKEHTLDAA